MTPDDQTGATLLPNPKWIRGFIDGVLVVDSQDVMGVWDNRHFPSWYLPVGDVVAELRSTGRTEAITGVGECEVHDLVVGDTVRTGAALTPGHSSIMELKDRVRLEFASVDRWFEEDVEVFSEPRNPYVRVDVLPSSRHVTVSHGGVVVADTHKPTVLYETGVAPRFYIPPTDVNLALLRPASRATSCPYKGFAAYWTVVVDGDELLESAWSYATPFAEARLIAGMLSFYTNRFVVEMDGKRITN